MNERQLAKCLCELGNITRLQVFKLLVESGHQGLPVGMIQRQLKIPASTLSHHITKLISANLITQGRDGRIRSCVVNFDIMQDVIAALQKQYSLN